MGRNVSQSKILVAVAAVIVAAIIAIAFYTNEASAQERYNWSGLYVGAHVGYGKSSASTTQDMNDWCAPGDTACISSFVGPFNYDADGAFGGGTVGFNHQINAIVLGVEVDAGYMDLTGSRTSPSSNPLYHQDHSVDGGLYGLVAGRLGVSVGNALIYGKGGYVWIDGEQDMTTTRTGFVTTKADGFEGWAYGGGLEYALGRGWSLKAEYLRLDLDAVDAAQTRVSDDWVFENHTAFDAVDTVKIGVNYKFGEADRFIPSAPLK